MCKYSSSGVPKGCLCNLKQPVNCVRFGTVGSATNFYIKDHEFNPALGKWQHFSKTLKANGIT